MPFLSLPLSGGLLWLRAAVLAAVVFFAGLTLFRLGVRRLVAWTHRAQPEKGQALIGHLAVPYVVTLNLVAANAFRGLLGPAVDWWLGALSVPALVVLLIEVVRLGLVDTVLRWGGRPVPRILRDIAFGVVYTTALLIYMGAVFKVDLAPFLTTSAILSVVIGMALQDTLGNLFAGLAINLDRPFDLGDWVSIDGVQGQVVEITWRATKIVTVLQETHALPNNSISKANIVNYQHPTTCYAEAIEVGLSYDAPPAQVRRIMLDVAARVPGVRQTPAPVVNVVAFGDSAVTYQISLWVDDFGARLVMRGRFLELLWYQLRREGVAIPYPMRTVEVVDAQAAAAESQRENLRALNRVDIIAVMDPESVAALSAKIHSAHYTVGERIFSQGDEGGSLYIIKRGMVTLSLDHRGGKNTVPFATLEVGAFFGEMSLLTGERRTASAHATTDCELLVIEQHHMAPLLEAHPEFTERMSRTLVERRRQIERTKLTFAEASSRVDAAPDLAKNEAEVASSELFNRIRSFFKLT